MSYERAIITTSNPIPIPSSSGTHLSWGYASLDTLGFWSAANPTRITIPAGVTLVKLMAAWRMQMPTKYTQISARIERNGANGGPLGGFPFKEVTSVGPESITPVVGTTVLEVSEGDYFEAYMWHSAGTTINVELTSPAPFFSIEAL